MARAAGRVEKALLGQQAYARGNVHPTLDLKYGGQHGWSPNLTEWVSNQAYIRRNLIPVLLEAPRFFNLMPQPEKWVETLRSLIELHCKTIEGMSSGLEVETEEHAVGGAGEMQQEVTNVTRARTNPSFTFIEKYGRPVQNFLERWIEYGLMSADSKYALINTIHGNTSPKRPTDMLADWYSATVLFMEPDPTHSRVLKSWVTTNMYPKGTGEIIGKRDLTEAGELLTLTLEFTGLTQTGLGTNVFAQKILDNINLKNAAPTLKPSFAQQISPDVRAASDVGYEYNLEKIAKTAITGVITQ